MKDSKETYEMIAVITETGKLLEIMKSVEETGGYNMCKAIDEMVKAGERRGMEQGIQRGIEQGMQRGMEQGMQRGMEQGMQRGIEQGMQRGMEQGIQQGIEQGRRQGIEQGRRQGIEQGRRQGIEQGRQQGIERGESQLGLLISRLFADGRTNDVQKAATDEKIRKEFYKEYGIAQ